MFHSSLALFSKGGIRQFSLCLSAGQQHYIHDIGCLDSFHNPSIHVRGNLVISSRFLLDNFPCGSFQFVFHHKGCPHKLFARFCRGYVRYWAAKGGAYHSNALCVFRIGGRVLFSNP